VARAPQIVGTNEPPQGPLTGRKERCFHPRRTMGRRVRKEKLTFDLADEGQGRDPHHRKAA
jgi:hypothetical protein